MGGTLLVCQKAGGRQQERAGAQTCQLATLTILLYQPGNYFFIPASRKIPLLIQRGDDHQVGLQSFKVTLPGLNGELCIEELLGDITSHQSNRIKWSFPLAGEKFIGLFENLDGSEKGAGLQPSFGQFKADILHGTKVDVCDKDSAVWHKQPLNLSFIHLIKRAAGAYKRIRQR
jgi:hypothetical protein